MKHDSSKLYKIAVSYLTHTPKDLDEIQDLFEKLGYRKGVAMLDPTINFIGTFSSKKPHYTSTSWCELENHTLITVQQLKDMVVLERVDVNDATHCYSDHFKYLELSGDWYVYSNTDQCWVISINKSNWFKENLTAIKQTKHKEEDMQSNGDGLISGADALRALADGKEVQQWNGSVWWDVEGNYQINVFRCGKYKFRLKPKPILLNGIEIPAPFTPKIGELFYFVSTHYLEGFSSNDFSEDWKEFTQYGAWKTEAEIKQVVEALRSVFKVN